MILRYCFVYHSFSSTYTRSIASFSSAPSIINASSSSCSVSSVSSFSSSSSSRLGRRIQLQRFVAAAADSNVC